MEWTTPTRAQHDEHAGGGAACGGHHFQAGFAMHLPAEQGLGCVVEAFRPVPDDDIASNVAVPGRQEHVAGRADLLVREGGHRLTLSPGVTGHGAGKSVGGADFRLPY